MSVSINLWGIAYCTSSNAWVSEGIRIPTFCVGNTARIYHKLGNQLSTYTMGVQHTIAMFLENIIMFSILDLGYGKADYTLTAKIQWLEPYRRTAWWWRNTAVYANSVPTHELQHSTLCSFHTETVPVLVLTNSSLSARVNYQSQKFF
jgi:hypothetical protein